MVTENVTLFGSCRVPARSHSDSDRIRLEIPDRRIAGSEEILKFFRHSRGPSLNFSALESDHATHRAVLVLIVETGLIHDRAVFIDDSNCAELLDFGRRRIHGACGLG